MTRAELVAQIKQKRSFLCVGLDTDPAKIPAHLLDLEDPIYEFNKAIIEATLPYCVAYKPNFAFFEAMGEKGMKALRKTMELIPSTHFTIADAKRGDIGNTSERYAAAYFNDFSFDSVTVAPYMGSDSVQPFMKTDGKWTILLALTSNPGADDFEQLTLSNGKKLYEQVVDTAKTWGTPEQLMFVVGATRVEALKSLRERAPEYFFLIPGVGAQGGDLKSVSLAAMNLDCGMLVNASRSILYASSGEDFAIKAAAEARLMQEEMAVLLTEHGL
jgi:orotidine-5'-phosphate decarboxylase